MATEPNNSGNAGASTPGADNAGGNKVVFTEEQQAKVNELIQTSMGRAGAEARERAASLEAELASARAELKAAQEALSASRTPGEKKDAKGDIAALQAQIDEMKSARQQLQDEVKRSRDLADARTKEVEAAKAEALNIRKQVAITTAASKQNFIDPSIAVKITEGNITYDQKTGRFVVLGDNGQERLNASFEPMTLDEYYNEFATKNPYLVRADVRGGMGSTQNTRFDVSNNGKYQVTDIFGKNSSSIKAAALKKENPAEYHRLKVIAQDQGLLGGKKRT